MDERRTLYVVKQFDIMSQNEIQSGIFKPAIFIHK